MVLLEIENLKTHYFAERGVVRAVDGAWLDLDKGEAVGLAGESGCGKTTLGYSAMRLVAEPGRIVEGSIRFDGTDLLQMSEDDIRKVRWKEISMVFQSAMNALNPVMKVGDQIANAIRFHKGVSESEAKNRAASLFEEVGLGKGRLDNYPFEFSGGMKQRAVIALALSCEPRLIIADEPVTALDVTIQAQILDLISRLRKEHDTSLVLISHDLSVICETCDKVAVMYAGRTIEYGTVESVFLKPIHPYTKGLIDAIPSMEKGKTRKLFAIPGKPPDLIAPPMGCGYHPRCPYAKPVCKERLPQRRSIGGRSVECHFAEEVLDFTGRELYQASTEAIERRVDVTRQTLRVSNLRKLFPVRAGLLASMLSGVQAHLRAVDGVSFDVGMGEIFGLVGESGCGKTTTGRCLAKPYEATDGQIIFNGINLSPLKKKEFGGYRRDIQMIFQDPYEALDPRQNVYDAISEPLKIHHMMKSREEETNRVRQLLELMRLVPPENYMTKFPHELSGGERQRVVVARVMTLNPKVIIADEPVSMLDVSVRAGILDIMLRLRREYDVTVIFITHDLAIASYLTDRICVMYLGQIVEIGPTENVVKDPLHPYTQGLIASVPSPDPLKERRKVAIIGEPPSPISPPSGCRFRTRCPYAKDICSKEKPPLVERERKHFVACFASS